MNLLLVGDTVAPQLYDFFRRDRFPERIEAILSTGDLPTWYLSYLMSIFNAPLYYVRGNHDHSFDTHPPDGGESIDNKVVDIKGIKVIGFEGSMHYFAPRAVQYTERQMWWKWQRLRFQLFLSGSIDIILTHAPPFGIHDAEDQCHKGFLTFSHMIHKYKPRYFIHGHTHLNYGINQKRLDVVNETSVINTYGYHILDVDSAVENRL